MNLIITQELERIPRGDLPQNIYRSVYTSARENALGSRPEIGTDPAEAHAVALRTVRGEHPTFTPEFLP